MSAPAAAMSQLCPKQPRPSGDDDQCPFEFPRFSCFSPEFCDYFGTNGDDFDLDDGWECRGEIAKGSYGRVFHYIHKTTGDEIAVKRSRTDDPSNAAVTEAKILMELDHPYVLKMHGFYYDRKAQEWVMLSEYLSGGTFEEVMAPPPTPDCDKPTALPNEGKIARRAYKVLKHVELIDFGLSFDFACGRSPTDNPGSRAYAAPQLFARDGRYSYGTKCDIWSFGVTLYESFAGCGCHPWPCDKGQQELCREQIQHGHFSFSKGWFEGKVWNGVSDELKDLICRCLTVQENNRPTATQAMDHPWFLRHVFGEPSPATGWRLPRLGGHLTGQANIRMFGSQDAAQYLTPSVADDAEKRYREAYPDDECMISLQDLRVLYASVGVRSYWVELLLVDLFIELDWCNSGEVVFYEIHGMLKAAAAAAAAAASHHHHHHHELRVSPMVLEGSDEDTPTDPIRNDESFRTNEAQGGDQHDHLTFALAPDPSPAPSTAPLATPAIIRIDRKRKHPEPPTHTDHTPCDETEKELPILRTRSTRIKHTTPHTRGA
ncbi:unnamed protein product [Vitrella brassicaformis CCMP3155]|uniref:Protein kinase domain-containing protein n=1 Tax=Vitrella brassicaformis (strain CCMP3155) TaxID=1169540 RepID=A0A0G4EE21_VITBC|nr:unnamed protein product [Vitrella brassicaformis CCMP3155]|eukprot:CEL93994.1 unnamed protein product [Vitrella brassicaformis CCMP3155]